MLFIAVYNKNVLCIDGACRGPKKVCIIICTNDSAHHDDVRGQSLNPKRSFFSL